MWITRVWNPLFEFPDLLQVCFAVQFNAVAPAPPAGGKDDDNSEIYESIEDIWPDYPTKEDFMWNEEEY